jgi:hypothetical protein
MVGARRILAAVVGIGLAWALLGLAADSLSGRFDLDTKDLATTYSWMRDDHVAGGFRVLWIGDPTRLPADPKTVGGTGFALTRNGTGDARALWAAPSGAADRELGKAVAQMQRGATFRLGHLVASAGVRYVAFVTGERGGNAALAGALGRQLDLTLSRVDANSTLYQNDAFVPLHALLPAAAGASAVDVTVSATIARTELGAVPGVRTSGTRTEPTGPGTLLWSEASNANWRAHADGHSLARRDAFGSTNAFTVPARARVDVHYSAGIGSLIVHLFEILLWLAAVAIWFVTRRKRSSNGGAA